MVFQSVFRIRRKTISPDPMLKKDIKIPENYYLFRPVTKTKIFTKQGIEKDN